MGIRAALGASRWRLVRTLLVEGVVLSLAGAAIGVLLAYGGVQVIKAWLPAGLPRVAAIGLDYRVLFAAIAAAVLTGTLLRHRPRVPVVASGPDECAEGQRPIANTAGARQPARAQRRSSSPKSRSRSSSSSARACSSAAS